jgi:hypothetical protein
MLTEKSVGQFTDHVASQGHAMAGATIAASAALACSLGEVCLRLNAPLVPRPDADLATHLAGQLVDARDRLLALTNADGDAITAFAALRAAGKTLEGQELLCQMPAEMARLACAAADLLQQFRPCIVWAQDDLEMAITLLAGAGRAASLLLDSNLRLWPDPPLLAQFEPELAARRAEIGRIRLVERIRP